MQTAGAGNKWRWGVEAEWAGSQARVLDSPMATCAVAESNLTAWSEEQEQLLSEHMQTVRFVARSVHERLPQHVELEELLSAGTMGLMDAVRRYNPERRVQFRSYAQFRIRGAILDSLRAMDWGPRELRRKGRALGEATRVLRARLGRTANDGELASEMGLSLASLQELRGDLQGLEIGTLHAERGEEGGGEEELAFVPAKEEESPLFQCLQGEARQRLQHAIDGLPERERLIMTLYYFEEMTMKQIGAVLGVVESRISQMHQMAVHRLRVQLRDLGSRKMPPRPVRSRRRAS